MSIIELDKLSLQVAERILLHKLNFNLSDGEKAVIYGRSGAGKSSLLRALTGFFPIAAGTIRVDNVQLNRENIRIIRSKITFLTQESIPGGATALESIMLPYTFKANAAKRPAPEKVAEILDLVGLPQNILSSEAATLSGGEKQRLAIARGLLLGKKIMLADEITSALDAAARDRVMDLLLSLPITLLAVSHDSAVISRFPLKYELAACTLKLMPPGDAELQSAGEQSYAG